METKYVIQCIKFSNPVLIPILIFNTSHFAPSSCLISLSCLKVRTSAMPTEAFDLNNQWKKRHEYFLFLKCIDSSLTWWMCCFPVPPSSPSIIARWSTWSKAALIVYHKYTQPLTLKGRSVKVNTISPACSVLGQCCHSKKECEMTSMLSPLLKASLNQDIEKKQSPIMLLCMRAPKERCNKIQIHSTENKSIFKQNIERLCPTDTCKMTHLQLQ